MKECCDDEEYAWPAVSLSDFFSAPSKKAAHCSFLYSRIIIFLLPLSLPVPSLSPDPCRDRTTTINILPLTHRITGLVCRTRIPDRVRRQRNAVPEAKRRPGPGPGPWSYSRATVGTWSSP